jgi:hypothetical protein
MSYRDWFIGMKVVAIPEHIMAQASGVYHEVCEAEPFPRRCRLVIALALLAAEHRGRDAERERCARVADRFAGQREDDPDDDPWDHAAVCAAQIIATAIRNPSA